MSTNSIDHIRTVSATYLHDYIIRFEFSDGKIHDLDFYPFLSKKPQNPMISKYLDLDLFKKFEMNGDDILWNDYEMCYSFFTLYYGFQEGPKREVSYYENAPIIARFPVALTPQKRKRRKAYA